MRKTIRKVTIVVPVLITNCHSSEKAKNGPETAHTSTTPKAIRKADLLPVSWVVQAAARPNRSRRTADLAPSLGPGHVVPNAPLEWVADTRVLPRYFLVVRAITQLYNLS